MRLLVSGATATLRRHASTDRLGCLLVPGAGNRVQTALDAGLPWAADNAAFTGFDPGAFCAMLGRTAGHPGCLFVACPDVVGNAAETMACFAVWEPLLHALGLPVALVGQDGAENLELPWGRFEALFVGGSTDWKLGPAAAALVREAKRRGLLVHFGRCNTKKRFRHAFALGCDSVDGSGFSRWPDQRIPLALNWLANLHGDEEPQESSAATGFFRGRESCGLGILDAPGWSVERVEADEWAYRVSARYRAEPSACPNCGRSHPAEAWLRRQGSVTSVVRDAPRHGRALVISVRRERFRCAGCGRTFVAALPGVCRGKSVTGNLVDYIRQAAGNRPLTAIAREAGIDEKTARLIRR